MWSEHKLGLGHMLFPLTMTLLYSVILNQQVFKASVHYFLFFPQMIAL